MWALSYNQWRLHTVQLHKQQWFKVVLLQWPRQAVGAHRGQLVEAGKQLVQCHDQLLRRALRRQAGEALDVCKQYAAGEVMVEVAREDREEKEDKRDREWDQSIKYRVS